MNAGSHKVETVAPGDLDTFTTSLIQAGFATVKGDEHEWAGPIDPAFNGLTEAQQMTFQIPNGWPFSHTKLFVQGLGRRRHVNVPGEVCLWETDDPTLEWMTLDGIRTRIAAWCEQAVAGPHEPALDTHLYYGKSSRGMLLINLTDLQQRGVLHAADGRMGTLGATRERGDFIGAGKGTTKFRWYRRSSLLSPPDGLTAVAEALTDQQRRDFASQVQQPHGRHGRRSPFLLWWTDNGHEAVLAVDFPAGFAEGRALEVAREDNSIRTIRAGEDAPTLAQKRAVVFGVGAVGSHLIVDLARSGLGQIAIWDSQRLRPGDTTRHAGFSPGYYKVNVVGSLLAQQAPATKVVSVPIDASSPDQFRQALQDVDIAVDATGDANVLRQLSLIVSNETPEIPIVSIALHRKGTVARARVQTQRGTPIYLRTPELGFPSIAALDTGLEEPPHETGCGAPINNAPPWAVAAAAALGARTAIDVLIGEARKGQDLVDVYRASDADGLRDRGLRVYEDLA